PEQQQRVGELVESIDLDDAIAFEHRLMRRMISGNGTGMADRQGRAFCGAANLQRDDGNVPLPSLAEPGNEAGRIAHRLEEETDNAGALLLQREIEIIRGGGCQLLPRGHRQVVTEPSVVVTKGTEHRSRMSDQSDTAADHPVRRRETADPQADVEIV